MDTCPQDKLRYNNLPKKVSRKEFNQYIASSLRKPTKGPKSKISSYKIFNYILYVLHTGIQWDQLKTYRHELHWSNVYKWHNRWSKDGSYHNLFLASVVQLQETGKLDVSILHGDGSNTVAKKGVNKSAIPVINTKKVRKPWPFVIISVMSSLR